MTNKIVLRTNKIVLRTKIRMCPYFFILFLFCLVSCQKKQIPEKEIAKTNILPAYGDTYVETSLGDASYLNPILATDSASGSVNGYVYNGLVKYDRDIKLVGDLAERWTISNHGLVITFKLRKNVKWHDGVPFTAEDVKFTYKKLIDPETKTPYSSDYKLVKSLDIIDKYTLRITYQEPFAPALESWGMGIVPKHIFESGDFNANPANRKPIGTGPYKFVEWKTDEKIVLVANNEYFEGRPYIDRIIIKTIPDQAVQFLELRNDSIDSMGLTPDQYKAYPEFFKNHNKFRYPSFAYTYLGFNLNHKLFKDRNVRQAIAQAINKKEIVAGVLLGMGKPADGPFPPQSWAYDENITDYEYAPEKSKELLKNSGFEDSDNDGWLDNKKIGIPKFEFTLITNQGNKMRALSAEIIQDQLKKIGIKVNIRIIEWSTFIHNFIDKRDFDAVILGWALARDPDQYAIWHSAETKEGQYNFVSYKNPKVDELLEKGRRTFDINKRQRIYKEIHNLIHHDIPYVFLYYPESLPVVHKRIQNVEVAPIGLGWNFIKWYVPQSKQKYSW